MLSFVTLFFLCTSYTTITSLAKQASVSPKQAANGVQISTHSASVQTSSTEWKVTFVSQEGYDLLLSLSSEFGFHATNPSTITLTLNGTNYNAAEGDLLLVFSVSNLQYFAVVIRTEVSSQLYKSYPQSYASPLSQSNVQQMISRSSPDRWNRITKNDSWSNTIPVYKNPSGEGTKWPIQITIVNDPIANTLRYSQHDTATDTDMYSATYLTSFAPNDGIDVYLMTDGESESFGIYDIYITYDIEWIHTTIKPTSTPTTLAPSVSPTTLIPTTSVPSTVSPTYLPTVSPTILPTISPTTIAPTTRIPTQIATFIPTNDSDSTTDWQIVENTLRIQQETVNTDYDTNISIRSEAGEDIDFIVVHSNHNDIAIVSVLATCIGSVFCIFTLVLLCCCIQSQRAHVLTPNKAKYHKPQMSEYACDVSVIASAADVKINAVANDEDEVYPIENQSEATVSPSSDIQTLNAEEEEQKEGELLTVNGVDINMSDLMQYDTASAASANTSKRRLMVHDVNVHTIIDYGKMEMYLNDEMSSSSHENILEERR